MKQIKWDARQLTKAAIITLTVLTLIYLINSMTTSKEKNDAYFSTPNGTNQKIMTVNQTTGEINFVDKSVQALNDELVNDYATIKDAMKVLLGENLLGDTDGEIFDIKKKLDTHRHKAITSGLSEGWTREAKPPASCTDYTEEMTTSVTGKIYCGDDQFKDRG